MAAIPVYDVDNLSGVVFLPSLMVGVNRSGTITTGGTAQVIAAANSSRKSLTIQNISNENLWVNEIGGTAAIDSSR